MSKEQPNKRNIPTSFDPSLETEKSRQLKYSYRTNSIVKKAYELSVLCGIDVGLIIEPNNNVGPSKPITWPEDDPKLKKIMQTYKDTPEDLRVRYTEGLSGKKICVKKKEPGSCKKIMETGCLKEDQVRNVTSKVDSKKSDCLKEDRLRNIIGRVDCEKTDRVRNVRGRVDSKQTHSLKENRVRNILGRVDSKQTHRLKEDQVRNVLGRRADYMQTHHLKKDQVRDVLGRRADSKQTHCLKEDQVRNVLRVVDSEKAQGLKEDQLKTVLGMVDSKETECFKQDPVENVIGSVDSKLETIIRRIQYLESNQCPMEEGPETTESLVSESDNCNSNVMQQKCDKLLAALSPCAPIEWKKWAKPPENWIKINFCGAIRYGEACGVCIARSHLGTVTGGATSTYLSADITHEVNEAKALHLAMQIALLNKWENVIFEGDSEWVLFAVTNSSVFTALGQACHRVLHEVKNFLQGCQFWKLTYSHWSTNEAAFELANWAFDSGISGILKPDNLPHQVSLVVKRESLSGESLKVNSSFAM